MKNTTTPEDIYGLFKNVDLNEEECRYLSYHKERIAFNVDIVSSLIGARESKKIKLLDVGPHLQTQVFRRYLGAEVEINTLGWFDERLVPRTVVDHHFQFDLNNSGKKDAWPDPKRHDLVVMAEVIEHLYTSPSLVLDFLGHFVAEGGYLIIQTPNAVDVTKRGRMLLGYNPYERIREDRSNPGHFREYTAAELQEYMNGNEWQVEETLYCDYWPQTGVRRVLELVFPVFRRGLTTIVRRL